MREGAAAGRVEEPIAGERLEDPSCGLLREPHTIEFRASIHSDTSDRMYVFHRSDVFDTWLAALKDKRGRARIVHRIRSAEHGNFGDCEPVGEGVSEMRVHFGPGYRVYFTRRRAAVYLLLVGGDKSSQQRDIKRALEMARTLGDE